MTILFKRRGHTGSVGLSPLLALLALSAAPGRSSAQSASPAPSLLEWTAPGECRRSEWLEGEIARLLGRSDGHPNAGTLRARGEVTRVANGGYRAHLETHADWGDGERTLEGGDCDGVTEAAAVVVALAIDPSAASTILSRHSPAPPASPTARPVERIVRASLGVAVLGDVGTLPGPDVGAGLFAALSIRSMFRFELATSTWLPQSISLASVVPGSAQIGIALLVGARVCAEHLWHSFVAGGCAGAEIGVMHATEVEGVSQPMTPYAVSLGVLAGPSLAWLISRHLALRTTLDADLLPLRPTFSLSVVSANGSTNSIVWQPSWIVGRATLDLEVMF